MQRASHFFFKRVSSIGRLAPPAFLPGLSLCRGDLRSLSTVAGAAAAVVEPAVDGALVLEGLPQTAFNPKSPADCVVRVRSSRNNVHITVSDLDGLVVSRSSGGMVGRKHRERALPEAAQEVAEQAVAKAVAKGFKMGHLEMQGSSSGRGHTLRGIMVAGLAVKSIRDTTPVPTPGVRPRAARRL